MPRRLAVAFLFAVRVAETVDRISPLTPRQIEQRIEDPLRVIVPDGDLFRAVLERIKAGLPVGELILRSRVAIQAHQLTPACLYRLPTERITLLSLLSMHTPA